MARNTGSTGQGHGGGFERKRRRSFGSIRRQRSGRYQASYVGPDRVRYYSADNYEAKADAEGWLRDERRLIEWNEWTHPGARAASEADGGEDVDLQAAAVPNFDTYARAWIESRVTTKGVRFIRARGGSTSPIWTRFWSLSPASRSTRSLPATLPAGMRTARIRLRCGTRRTAS